MIAGLPGTGIGGIFYIMSAVLMPVREIFKTFRGRSSLKRWKFIGWQLLLTLGVLGGFWLTGLALGFSIHVYSTTFGHSIAPGVVNPIQTKPFLISMIVLGSILIGVEFLNALLPHLPPHPPRLNEPVHPTRLNMRIQSPRVGRF